MKNSISGNSVNAFGRCPHCRRRLVLDYYRGPCGDGRPILRGIRCSDTNVYGCRGYAVRLEDMTEVQRKKAKVLHKKEVGKFKDMIAGLDWPGSREN